MPCLGVLFQELPEAKNISPSWKMTLGSCGVQGYTGVYRGVQECAVVCKECAVVCRVCAGVCSHGLTLFRYNKLALNLTINDQGVPSLVKRR